MYLIATHFEGIERLAKLGEGVHGKAYRKFSNNGAVRPDRAGIKSFPTVYDNPI